MQKSRWEFGTLKHQLNPANVSALQNPHWQCLVVWSEIRHRTLVTEMSWGLWMFDAVRFLFLRSIYARLWHNFQHFATLKQHLNITIIVLSHPSPRGQAVTHWPEQPVNLQRCWDTTEISCCFAMANPQTWQKNVASLVYENTRTRLSEWKKSWKMCDKSRYLNKIADVYCTNDMVKKKHGVVNNNTILQEPPKPSDSRRICVGCMIPRSRVCHIWSYRPRQWLWFARILAKPRMDTQIRPKTRIGLFHFKVGRLGSWDFKLAFNDWP